MTLPASNTPQSALPPRLRSSMSGIPHGLLGCGSPRQIGDCAAAQFSLQKLFKHSNRERRATRSQAIQLQPWTKTSFYDLAANL
ncbi:hypothetical protein BC567DRAFT_95788 [Phyllosticta citribraziliensis]